MTFKDFLPKPARLPILILCLASFSAKAKPDSVAITQTLVNQYVDGWQKKSGDLFARPFADDAHFVNIFGMHFTGKKKNAQRHQKIFDGFLKGTNFVTKSIKASKLRENIIVAHVVWKLENFQSDYCQANPKENSLRCPRKGIFNHVLTKKKSKVNEWEIIETQNTLILPPPSKKHSS